MHFDQFQHFYFSLNVLNLRSLKLTGFFHLLLPFGVEKFDCNQIVPVPRDLGINIIFHLFRFLLSLALLNVNVLFFENR